MTGLPWVRLDTDFAHNPKTLHLVAQGRWRAVVVYVSALGWCQSHGTDGHIPVPALPLVHGTRKEAQQLVEAGLWHPSDIGGGWIVNDWADYQPTDMYRKGQSLKAQKGNCIRWHGHACGCWKASPSESPSDRQLAIHGTKRN